MPSPSQVGGRVGGQVGCKCSGGKIPLVEVPPVDGVDDLRELTKKKEAERLSKLEKDMVEDNGAKFEKGDTGEPEPVGESGEQIKEVVRQISAPSSDEVVVLTGGELGKIVRNSKGAVIRIDPVKRTYETIDNSLEGMMLKGHHGGL